MPTLFRLAFVLGVLFAAGYGALYGIANAVKPQERTIEQAVALPAAATDVHTGRSAAEVLNRQATEMTRHRRHSAR